MLPLTELLRRDDDAVAVIDADTGRVLTHAALQSAVAARADTWSGLSGRLAFLGVGRGLVSVIDLLALIRSGATTALLDRSAPPDRLARWVAAYEPEAVLGFDAAPDTPVPADGRPPLPEAVLMATSGSTGSPKFVRLSAAGVVANAEQIVTATRIGEHDRALAHLPLSSVYGLSVVTSHLVAGACIVLSATSATRPQFAAVLAEHAVTSLPGVPFSLEMYRRTGLLSRDLPALRDLTAAGGRVPDDLLAATIDACHVSGRRFWPMYGQTEACGRISVLPADELPDMAGSVGYPVPGTRVWIADADADGRGTVHVSGPGNMLGYATGRADVGAGSDPVADLDTGDLGRLDAAGRLWITGRSQRIVKLNGLRVALDDVEAQLAVHGIVAALPDGDRITVVIEAGGVPPGLARELDRAMGFAPRSISVVAVPRAPRTAGAKIDYGRLIADLDATTTGSGTH